MKLNQEKQELLEKIKSQISMEREYINNNFDYPMLFNQKSNNFGFINIIPIVLILIVVTILLLIFL